MTVEFIYALVASAAGVFGAIAGRVFAVEAQNTLAAVLSATYVGAGAGLVSSLPLGSLLTLVASLWNSQEFANMFDALDVSGRAVMLGIGAGAAGGLAISIAVAATKLWQRSR